MECPCFCFPPFHHIFHSTKHISLDVGFAGFDHGLVLVTHPASGRVSAHEVPGACFWLLLSTGIDATVHGVCRRVVSFLRSCCVVVCGCPPTRPCTLSFGCVGTGNDHGMPYRRSGCCPGRRIPSVKMLCWIFCGCSLDLFQTRRYGRRGISLFLSVHECGNSIECLHVLTHHDGGIIFLLTFCWACYTYGGTVCVCGPTLLQFHSVCPRRNSCWSLVQSNH